MAMDDEQLSFYYKLREKIVQWAGSPEGQKNKWAEYILIVPDLFYLLYKLIRDPEMPLKNKAKLGVALAYFISPVDLIPEMFLGPLGFTDDIVITALVIDILFNKTDPDLIRRHWAGEEDILLLVQRILRAAPQMVGKGILGKIRALLKITGR
jgi:uncharacterized membrane protein YkvA (DUF1232 family)